ncbi:MAG: phosphoglucosamine mutase [candidate division Zixibacteria bacterium CG_4_9_14_3_um_filter_46_8]|nr:MAG: phosphoglucosamine mutase [candidate division Zixibacteria bacterium CG_4_9_14_3_um_filter_46_8]
MISQNLIKSVSGIRGIVGAADGLTPEVALQYAAAFASFCRQGAIVLGSDTRPSRRVLIPAVVSGITGCGRDVIDIGICPTPTVELAVKELKAVGGIVITASHNPPEWNALKMINSKGMFLSASEIARVENIFVQGKYSYARHKRLGNIYPREFVAIHIDKILKLRAVKVSLLRKRGLKVALDCVNGAGAMLSPRLLKELGCRVFCVNCEPTGVFARGAEPIQKNLKALCTAVIRNKCDIGFAHDPDADRLAIVDEKGRAIGEEYTLAFALDYILSLKKGPIAVNLSTSSMSEAIATRYGVKVHRTKVGEINVSLKLRTIKGVIGGEGNGGVIYPPLLLGRDGAVGIALILSYLAQRKMTVSQAVESLPKLVMIKDKVVITREELDLRKSGLYERFKQAKINIEDGVKFNHPRSWVHIRPSNTEPITRIIAEAPSKAEALELIETVRALLIT